MAATTTMTTTMMAPTTTTTAKTLSVSKIDVLGEGLYTGEALFETQIPHGTGRMEYYHSNDTIESYQGEWKYGNWDGQGVLQFRTGDLYIGEFKDDTRTGNGFYQWTDGRTYQGPFEDNQRHGPDGVYQWPGGAEYQGDFHLGKRHGKGLYRFSNGNTYEGAWKDGHYEGYGTFTWSDGRKYKGEWKNSQHHGVGTEWDADGNVVHDGMWIHHEPFIRQQQQQRQQELDLHARSMNDLPEEAHPQVGGDWYSTRLSDSQLVMYQRQHQQVSASLGQLPSYYDHHDDQTAPVSNESRPLFSPPPPLPPTQEDSPESQPRRNHSYHQQPRQMPTYQMNQPVSSRRPSPPPPAPRSTGSIHQQHHNYRPQQPRNRSWEVPNNNISVSGPSPVSAYAPRTRSWEQLPPLTQEQQQDPYDRMMMSRPNAMVTRNRSVPTPPSSFDHRFLLKPSAAVTPSPPLPTAVLQNHSRTMATSTHQVVPSSSRHMRQQPQQPYGAQSSGNNHSHLQSFHTNNSNNRFPIQDTTNMTDRVAKAAIRQQKALDKLAREEQQRSTAPTTTSTTCARLEQLRL